jgi:hypothetical protein
MNKTITKPNILVRLVRLHVGVITQFKAKSFRLLMSIKNFFVAGGRKCIIKTILLTFNLLLGSAIFTLILGCGYLFYLTISYLLANQNIVYFHLIRLFMLTLVFMIIIGRVLYFNPSSTYNLTIKTIKLVENNTKIVIDNISIPCYLIKMEKSKFFLNYTLIFYLNLILNLVVNLYSFNLPYFLTVLSKFVLISFVSFNLLSKIYFIYLINWRKNYIFNSFDYDDSNSFKNNLQLNIIYNSVNIFNFMFIYSYYIIQIIVSGFFVIILTDLTFISWIIRQLFETLGLVNTVYCQPANNSPIVPSTASSTSFASSSDNLVPITPFTPPFSPLLHINFLPDGNRPLGLGVLPRRPYPIIGAPVVPIAYGNWQFYHTYNSSYDRRLFWHWAYLDGEATNHYLDNILAAQRNVSIEVIKAESRALIDPDLVKSFEKRMERNLNKSKFNNFDWTKAAGEFWRSVEAS